ALKKGGFPDIGRIPRSVFFSALKGFREGFVQSGAYGSWIKPEDWEKYPVGATGLTVLGMPVEFLNKVFGGVLGAVGTGVEQGYKQITGDEQQAKRFARDIKGLAEQYFMGLSGVPHANVPPEVIEAYRKTRPYLDAGLEPPAGLDPLIDRVKTEQAKV